jgi:hypothetical protein
MSDDLSKRGTPDRLRINIHEAHEVRYWTEKFGCSEQQLRECVQRVGVMVTDVQRCLGK